MTTDEDGFYSFPGEIAQGGGVWVSPILTTYLIVEKSGYQDPPGLPPPTWAVTTAGWRELRVSGETRFDTQLLRR